MKNALSIYSDILILRDETYRALKRTPGAVTFILIMFFAVTLLAGCGKWLALPYQLSRPTMAERMESATLAVEAAETDVVTTLTDSLDAVSRENLSFTLGEVLPPNTAVTSAALAEAVSNAGLSTAQLIALVETQVEVPDDLVAELIGSEPNTAVVDSLLDATSLQPAQLRAILAGERAGNLAGSLTPGDRLTGALDGLFQGNGVQKLLTSALLTPDRVRDMTVRLGLDPATVSRLNARIEGAPGQVLAVLAITQEELERVEPPLGVGFGRFMTLFGDWLSTPFQILSTFLPLALVALIAAKLLGGKGSLVQHLLGMLLAFAPAFLLFLTFTGDLGTSVPITTQASIQIAGRILALIAFVWAFFILIKSLSVVHEYSKWRAVATLALTYGIIYILTPFLTFLAAGYLLRG